VNENQPDETETEAENLAPVIPELSQLMVLLLKGVLYRQDDERLWSALLRLQNRVREQAAVLLLELLLDEAEGYAFLKSRPLADDENDSRPLPRLIARRPLSYPVSLMLVLLRKRMAEADNTGGDTRLIVTREEIAELMRVFLPDGSNEARLIDQIDATINKILDLGFLRKLKSSAANQPARFEVLRILKAFVDAQWLADFDERLQSYRNALSGTADNEETSE